MLIDFGAAEFMGGVAGWSMPDYRQYRESKRGSVGRPRADVKLRTVDPETKEALSGPNQLGLLELFSPRFGPDWVRTNDFALIDEDGFRFIKGRADDAINRGGFKILPDDVSAVIRQFPGVQDATVVGFPDQRLGQVPVMALTADAMTGAEAYYTKLTKA